VTHWSGLGRRLAGLGDRQGLPRAYAKKERPPTHQFGLTNLGNERTVFGYSARYPCTLPSSGRRSQIGCWRCRSSFGYSREDRSACVPVILTGPRPRQSRRSRSGTRTARPTTSIITVGVTNTRHTGTRIPGRAATPAARAMTASPANHASAWARKSWASSRARVVLRPILPSRTAACVRSRGRGLHPSPCERTCVLLPERGPTAHQRSSCTAPSGARWPGTDGSGLSVRIPGGPGSRSRFRPTGEIAGE